MSGAINIRKKTNKGNVKKHVFLKSQFTVLIEGWLYWYSSIMLEKLLENLSNL